MPAIVFTIVDLPAPLSPTRPTTSPAWTAKSTRSRAWTGPNRLLTFSSSRSGAPVATRSPGDPCFRASGLIGAGAEFRGADEPVGDDRRLDVVFQHGNRFEDGRRHVGLPVVDFFGDQVLRGFFAFGQGDREFSGDLGLGRDFLVDRQVLLAGENPLQTRDGRVLTGDRLFFGVDAGAFQRCDRAAAGVVVSGVDPGEAVIAERGDRLLRLALGVFGGPARGVVLLRDLDARGVEPLVRSLFEQGGVGVGGVAVDHDHGAAGAAVFFQFFRQRFGLQFADFFVVEGDVGVDFAVFDQPVVADHRHVLGFRLFGDRRGRFRVHRVDDQDFGALGQRRFGLALLFGGVTAGVAVEDFAVFAVFFDSLFEVGLVVGFVTGRFVFGEQEGDLRPASSAAAATAGHQQTYREQRTTDTYETPQQRWVGHNPPPRGFGIWTTTPLRTFHSPLHAGRGKEWPSRSRKSR